MKCCRSSSTSFKDSDLWPTTFREQSSSDSRNQQFNKLFFLNLKTYDGWGAIQSIDEKDNSTFNWKLLNVIIIWLKGSNWPWGLSRNLAWNANNFLRLYILFIIFVCVSKVAWRISFKTKSRWSDVKVIICFDVCVKELLRLLSFTMFYQFSCLTVLS
jgi:hypothetical protein